MNRQGMIETLCNYVLSANNERDMLKLDIIERIEVFNIVKRSEKIKAAKDIIYESTWYCAVVLKYGKKEANREIKDLISEVL